MPVVTWKLKHVTSTINSGTLLSRGYYRVGNTCCDEIPKVQHSAEHPILGIRCHEYSHCFNLLHQLLLRLVKHLSASPLQVNARGPTNLPPESSSHSATPQPLMFDSASAHPPHPRHYPPQVSYPSRYSALLIPYSEPSSHIPSSTMAQTNTKLGTKASHRPSHTAVSASRSTGARSHFQHDES